MEGDAIIHVSFYFLSIVLRVYRLSFIVYRITSTIVKS